MKEVNSMEEQSSQSQKRNLIEYNYIQIEELINAYLEIGILYHNKLAIILKDLGDESEIWTECGMEEIAVS